MNPHGIESEYPFQCILLPKNLAFSSTKWNQLHSQLKLCGINSSFYSYYNNNKKEYYNGLKLLVGEKNDFSFFKTLLITLQFFHKTEIKLSFSHEFEKKLGNSHIKEFIEG